tara:strand:- start:4309 stop:4608 length:300 start_codon:yes stop_codon:yes gene_type:complete
VCKDGFSMSVQAHETAYCTPRANSAEIYTEVEVGYPTQIEELLMPWCEDEEKPCNTVYGYVPCHRVSLVITKHGGMVRGEVPNGVLIYDQIGQKLSSTK